MIMSTYLNLEMGKSCELWIPMLDEPRNTSQQWDSPIIGAGDEMYCGAAMILMWWWHDNSIEFSKNRCALLIQH